MIHIIEGTTFVCGLVLAALLAIFPRFGPGSRQLLFLVLPACFSAGLQALGTGITGLSPQDTFRLSFALIMSTAVGGYFAGRHLNRKATWTSAFAVLVPFVLLLSLMYLIA